MAWGCRKGLEVNGPGVFFQSGLGLLMLFLKCMFRVWGLGVCDVFRA